MGTGWRHLPLIAGTESVIDRREPAKSDETTDLASMEPSSRARRICEIARADA
jgi:hypothetical protein